jgi:hypothetical protein
MTKLYIGVIIEPDPSDRPVIVQTSTNRTDLPTVARGCIVHVLEVDVPDPPPAQPKEATP